MENDLYTTFTGQGEGILRKALRGVSIMALGKLLTVVIVFFTTVSVQAADGLPRYTFGIVPQQSSSDLVRTWAPILSYLGDKTGVVFDFATAKDIPTFEQQAVKGEYDFVYLSPYTYTVVHRAAAGYEAFAKERDKKLKGIIVVRRDSPYKTMRDLNNTTLAFPAAAAFAATIIPQTYFESEGIKIESKYVSSHESVYLAVAKGIYPAGGGVVRTFDTMPAATRDQLRVLWTTPGYTPHPFAAHGRVPKAVIERLRAAMVAMNQDPQGKLLLDRIAFLKGISAANDAEYNDTRALKITISDHLIK